MQATALLHFGLVKLVEPRNIHDAPTRDRRSISREGLVVGSASYMSPEQVQGMEVDERSDIFALGALLYEMLTGSRAFDGDNPLEIISAVLWDEPPPLDLPPSEDREGLKPVIERALEKDPDARFLTMSAFRQELARSKAAPACRRATSERSWIVVYALVLVALGLVYVTSC